MVYAVGILLAALLLVWLGLITAIWNLGDKFMADTSKLTAAVAKLSTDVQALLASNANVQPAIDTATAAVEAVDATVVAATPPPAA